MAGSRALLLVLVFCAELQAQTLENDASVNAEPTPDASADESASDAFGPDAGTPEAPSDPGRSEAAEVSEQPLSATEDPSAEVPAELDVPLVGEPAAPAIEVIARSYTEAERVQRSAEAVQVVKTDKAKLQTADLGEVLARTQGVGVQRAGGLGSSTRFSLNGLTDDQIRFFLDGVPLELAGYPFGIANVPVNMVERVEIFRGVVPIRFGADALGGAVNLVSDQNLHGTHASGSVQAGSFGTYRLTLSARHLHEPSGFFTRVSGFFDQADNDYPMNIPVPDDKGGESPGRVYRFHDGYRAQGVNVETGFVDKPWAERLLLRVFVTDYDKQVQHGLVMGAVPYGAITYGEVAAGGSLRYENTFAQHTSVRVIGGYTFKQMSYSDQSPCQYDWFGQCAHKRGRLGERLGYAQDQRYDDHSFYSRVNVEHRLRPEHTLRLTVSPTYTRRTGEERRLVNPDARDPLSARRNLLSMVSGVEYQADLFGGRLQNVLFAKDYLQILRSEEPLSNGQGFVPRERDTHRAGLGDSLRYTFAEWIFAKASYEWATRLPRPDEMFGNAFPIAPNLKLKPELSHNVNLGVTLDARRTKVGDVRADLNGFMRSADELIMLVGAEKSSSYGNVYAARSLGLEAAAGWTSKGEYLLLDANVTYVDFRNASDEGGYADFKGMRIPSRPYLFGNGSARLQFRQLVAPRDELALVWNARYVHPYFRGWEDFGTNKLTVNAQLLHSLGLVYSVRKSALGLSFTGEVQNLTDAEAYDFFRVPRPGRAFYFKTTASL